MKNQDNKTSELFPVDLLITQLRCTNQKLKRSKNEIRVELKLEGYTTARFETDLSNDDYLIAAAELLVRLCCEDANMAKTWIDTIESKYSIDELCEFRTGAKRPVVSGGNIGMTYSTQIDFDMDCLIVEKPTMIKLIARWVLMLAKGDSSETYRAINDGYLRLANNVIPFSQAA